MSTITYKFSVVNYDYGFMCNHDYNHDYIEEYKWHNDINKNPHITVVINVIQSQNQAQY